MRPIVHTALTPEAARVVSMAQPRSPWHSPVPYLFGGLAAMLGLIAFALLILACSYWRLSRDETQQQHNEGNDLESGGKLDGVGKMSDPPVFEEKIVVIMAGNEKPTFLATPALMFKHTSDDHHDHKHDRNVAKDDHEEDDEKSKEDQQHS